MYLSIAFVVVDVQRHTFFYTFFWKGVTPLKFHLEEGMWRESTCTHALLFLCFFHTRAWVSHFCAFILVQLGFLMSEPAGVLEK